VIFVTGVAVRAECHVGRVDGLAIGLEIGAAAFADASEAWGDAPSTGSTTGHSGSVNRGAQASSALRGTRVVDEPAVVAALQDAQPEATAGALDEAPPTSPTDSLANVTLLDVITWQQTAAPAIEGIFVPIT